MADACASVTSAATMATARGNRRTALPSAAPTRRTAGRSSMAVSITSIRRARMVRPAGRWGRGGSISLSYYGFSTRLRLMAGARRLPPKLHPRLEPPRRLSSGSTTNESRSDEVWRGRRDSNPRPPA